MDNRLESALFAFVKLGLVVCLAPLVFSQNDSENTARFEVASIKPSPGVGWSGLLWRNDFLRSPGTPLGALIMSAYRVQEYQITGGPAWLWQTTYSIDAKAPSAVGTLQMRTMLKNLLVDRFKLSTRTETRQLSGIALTVGKDGPKFARLPEGGRPSHSPRPNALPFTTMNELMGFLGRVTGLPLIDKTGLQGNFDIFLDFSGYQTPPGVESGSAADREANSEYIETVLLKQTGLTLVRGKYPFQMLVVDHVEQPSGN